MFMGGFFSAWFRTQRHTPPYYRLNDREDDGTLKCFTLMDLKTATATLFKDIHMNDAELSCVKGWIDEPGYGFDITVKMLSQLCRDHEEHNEWLRLINNMARLSHPNLAKLVGYCLEDINPILVYDFSAEGSLDHLLFKRPSNNFQLLSWKSRMKIAFDAATALAYLHSDEVRVIHGDFNASNILIDTNHNAKLSIFGLDKKEKLWSPSQCYAAAPEYIITGHQTNKSDAYSFGVVLLEIMSGKRVFDRERRHEPYLIEWAKPLLLSKSEIFQVMDCQMEGQYSLSDAMKVARIVIRCLSKTPKKRPNMDEVVRALEPLQNSNDTIGTVSPLCGN